MERILPKIDTYHLLIFYHVGREKSITVASEKLFLSQPTVTNHIKYLEESTQLKLIQIERKKLSLTEAGKGLFHYAEVLFQQAMAADRYVEILNNSRLYVGVCQYFVQVIAKVISEMTNKLNSSIKLEVRFGEPLKLAREVEESKIDLAVVPSFDNEFPNLHRTRIANKINLVFYANPVHPIFQKAEIRWADLGDFPLVIGSEASYLRKLVTNKLASEGLRGPPKYYSTGYNSELFKTIVQTGNYVSIAINQEIKDELERGILKVLPLPDNIYLDIDVIAYESHFSTHPIQEFISIAKSAFL
jgi:LysR family transcriptional regulator, transcriptional activator of the cysJI operon